MAYRNDELLKGDGEQSELAFGYQNEYDRCRDDLLYFVRNYMYINTKDCGYQLFNPRPKQVELMKLLQENRFVKGDWYRQAGFTTAVLAYMLWQAVFCPDTTAVYATYKKELSYELFTDIVRAAYRLLPYWMQPGVKAWTKKGIALSNGSCFKACAATMDKLGGYGIDILFLDEFGYIRDKDISDIDARYVSVLNSSARKRLITGCSERFSRHSAANTMFWQKCKLPFAVSENVWEAASDSDRAWEAERRNQLRDETFNEYYIGKGPSKAAPANIDGIPDMARCDRWKAFFHSGHQDWQKLADNCMVRKLYTDTVEIDGHRFPGLVMQCYNLQGVFVEGLDLRGLVNVDVEMYDWKSGNPVSRVRYSCLHLACLAKTGPLSYEETSDDKTRPVITELRMVILGKAPVGDKCGIPEMPDIADEEYIPEYKEGLIDYLEGHVSFC